jgi:hypothetical protein
MLTPSSPTGVGGHRAPVHVICSRDESDTGSAEDGQDWVADQRRLHGRWNGLMTPESVRDGVVPGQFFVDASTEHAMMPWSENVWRVIHKACLQSE